MLAASDGNGEVLASRAPSPSNHAIQSELTRALVQALVCLPERYQQAVAWRHQEQLSWDEIGQRMGCTADAVQGLEPGHPATAGGTRGVWTAAVNGSAADAGVGVPVRVGSDRISRGDAETRRKKGMTKDIDEITGEIVDAALKVHRLLGPGLLESVYEIVLARELERRGLRVERQADASFDFDGMHFDEGFRVHLLVEGAVIVELKSVEKLAAVHPKQVLTYLRLLKLPVGLLINFGVRDPQGKRASHRQRLRAPSLRVSASPREWSECDLTRSRGGRGGRRMRTVIHGFGRPFSASPRLRVRSPNAVSRGAAEGAEGSS